MSRLLRLRVSPVVLTRCARIAPICLFALAVCVATVHAATPPRITDLGGVVGYSTTARGINDAGEIVGEQSRYVNESSSESHGLLWRKDASGRYFPTEIGELADFPNSYPRSINGAGRIAGWAEVVDFSVWTPPSQVVMWEKDASGAYVPTDLGTPEGFWYSETAFGGEGGHVLNELGQITGGGVFLPSWQRHAYLWAEPGLSPPIALSPPGDGTSFKAYGVNNSGFAVGDSVQLRSAILWQKDASGDYSQVELPMPVGGERATAFDINDGGQIVGGVFASSSRSAVIWEKSAASGSYEARYLGLPPGATFSGAHAVNNSGDVVGWALIGVLPNAFRHAVLWRKDESGMLAPTDLGTLPGGASSEAYGINELGQIVGASTYWDETAQKTVRHAVLWDVADTTPPEIASASVEPAILWPPNHEMVSVTIAYAASDDSGSVGCHLGPVTSNELLAGADWEVLDAHHVLLRSERDGEGSGRTYVIPITCTDSAGNSAAESATVAVPHDRRR